MRMGKNMILAPFVFGISVHKAEFYISGSSYGSTSYGYLNNPGNELIATYKNSSGEVIAKATGFSLSASSFTTEFKNPNNGKTIGTAETYLSGSLPDKQLEIPADEYGNRNGRPYNPRRTIVSDQYDYAITYTTTYYNSQRENVGTSKTERKHSGRNTCFSTRFFNAQGKEIANANNEICNRGSSHTFNVNFVKT